MSCPLCGGEARLAFTVGDRNRGLGAELFSYFRCETCGAYFQAKPPADLARYYPPAYYGMPSLGQLEQAAEHEASKLALLEPFVTHGRLVEIGAGTGAFAYAAKQAGFAVSAIEMDRDCCEFLAGTVGVTAINSDAPQQALLDLEPVDAIVMWHALEHLPEPWGVVRAAAERLRPGGVLAIATPNPASLQFRLLGRRWAHVDAPRHLFLIPLAALDQEARRHGLEPRFVTTADAAGVHWNYFGWEAALRRQASRGEPSRFTRLAARAVATAVAPVERHGMNGAAYTAVFVR